MALTEEEAARKFRASQGVILFNPETGEPTGIEVTISAGDVQIGAVELKDGTGTNRAAIDATGRLAVVQSPSSATAVIVSGVVIGAAGVYRGFSLRETSGTAPATVRLYNNASAASGTIIETIQLNPGESRSESLPVGIAVVGIYFSLVSGAVEGSIRHG